MNALRRLDPEARAGLLFCAIPMALFTAFYLGPLVWSFWVSMNNWGLFGRQDFVGLGNYAWLAKDPTLTRAIRNTVTFTVLVVPAQMALGLSLALLINQPLRGRGFFRAAFYFPAVASTAAVTMIAMFVLAPGKAGLLNRVLGWVGLPGHGWLVDPHTAMLAIVCLVSITSAGGVMLFYLAALQGIPPQLYEAADIEGASSWQRFRNITFPMLRNTHFMVGTLATIGSMKMFDQAFIVSSGTGGPDWSTITVVFYVYRLAFADVTLGYAAAVGVMLLLFIVAMVLVQRRLFPEERA